MRITQSSPAFWRANIALFLSAFSVFALLYSVQPLLPVFSAEFALNAGQSSLSLSVTTGVLAFAMVLASWLADRWGRRELMTVCLLLSGLIGLAIAFIPHWGSIVALRALLGLSLSGVPAVAMVYLSEEMAPEAFGFSMGLYIGGNAIGGMAGRLLIGILSDYISWRFALGALGLLVLVNCAAFWWLLPPPRHSHRQRMNAGAFLAAVGASFRDRGLRLLFAEALLLMGAFVTLYNYTGFRLTQAPYSLSQTAVSFIFVIYLVGTGSSAWMGALAGRLGRRKVLWLMTLVMALGLALTCLPHVTTVIAGLAVTTFGFFGGHSIASSWVGRRARSARAQASALYLFFYYAGSSILGTAGGFAWTGMGWAGVVAVSGGAILAAFLISVRLFFLPPLAIPETPVEEPQAL
ncbi:MFS transporter [Radicibacter daui]|uniref:MFS transporter n=1 Tax=Radicibacter daui TaxID=3064829 RepID=UPI0040468925